MDLNYSRCFFTDLNFYHFPFLPFLYPTPPPSSISSTLLGEIRFGLAIPLSFVVPRIIVFFIPPLLSHLFFIFVFPFILTYGTLSFLSPFISPLLLPLSL